MVPPVRNRIIMLEDMAPRQAEGAEVVVVLGSVGLLECWDKEGQGVLDHPPLSLAVEEEEDTMEVVGVEIPPQKLTQLEVGVEGHPTLALQRRM